VETWPRHDALRLVDSVYGALVMERLSMHTATVLGAEIAGVLVRDRVDPASVVLAAVHGGDVDAVGQRFSVTRGAVGAVLRSGEPTVIENYGRFVGRIRHPESSSISSVAAAPVYVRGRFSASLSVATRDAERRFDPRDLELLGSLADLVGLALEQHGRRHELTGTAAPQADSLSSALAAWDDDTAAHSEEVLELARATGERLGLDLLDMIELELAAALHDVGKMRVPREVLRKPDPLTEAELAVVRRHPAWGAEILAAVPGLSAVAAVVRFHHERCDGRGYPDGLPKERIPLLARIVTACDAYGAMTRDRPYRGRMGRSRALAELRREAGAAFDPEVVAAMSATHK
jgi:HD-GYP domain-containing protein (c-di-GMP phosphodiesterase class II)